MSEKNQPFGNQVPDHGYKNLPPPPTYAAATSSYSHPPTAPPMSSGTYGNNDSPYDASRGYGQPQPNYYRPPQQYNPPFSQYQAPTPQQYGGLPYDGNTSNFGSSNSGPLDRLFGSSGPKRMPLNPPPQCLSRPPQFFQPLPPFAPVKIPCNGSHLDSGFPLMYPGHALFGHDVQEVEWIRFLEDLAISGRLDTGEKIRSEVFPLAIGAGLAGILISQATRRRMKDGKANQVGSLVDIWNGYYFHPRGVNVILMHGNMPLSGLDVYSSDSSSDEYSNHQPHSHHHDQYDRDDRRAARRENREQRRREKEMRRAQKREQRQQRRSHDKHLQYFLVVESRPI